MRFVILCALVCALWVAPAQAILIVKIENLTAGITSTFENDRNDVVDRVLESSFTSGGVDVSFNALSHNPFGRSDAEITKGFFAYHPYLEFSFSTDVVDSSVDLIVSVTDTDFVNEPGSAIMKAQVPGFRSLPLASVNFYVNPSNVAFDTGGASLISHDFLNDELIGGGPLDGYESNAGMIYYIPLGPYSFTQVLNVHLDSGESFSGAQGNIIDTFELRVIPEPDVLFLMGIGLAGMVVRRYI